jgi:hypothetical protein
VPSTRCRDRPGLSRPPASPDCSTRYGLLDYCKRGRSSHISRAKDASYLGRVVGARILGSQLAGCVPGSA